MFLDAGAEEIMVVAIAALIFVGPKDLPAVLRKVGQFTAKMRGLAAEFRASFDEMARQSELDDLRREVEALRRGDYTQPVRHDIDNHFEALHRELGAPPPSGFGAREGEVVAGPDAALSDAALPDAALAHAALPAPALPDPALPGPAAVHHAFGTEPAGPVTLSQDNAAARPPESSPPPAEHAG